MPIIHAVHLATWAETNVARDNLGELLRRLILANIELRTIKEIRFLSHESNQLSGWDGILECESTIPWIPPNTSVWELGTGSNTRQKIRDDFENRRGKELPAGWERGRATYVAVTLRKLDDLTALRNELLADSPWCDVKIIDAQALEEWIAVSPSVEAWLQEQGIGPPPTVRTLQRDWSEWSEKTHPPVSTGLILAERGEAAKALKNHLASPGAPINIQADSPEEAVQFVHAVVESTDTLFQEHFQARSLVIGASNDAKRFRDPSFPYNIILCPPATSESLSLARAGHTVINALGNESLANRVDIRLSRPLRSDFVKGLVEMGISEEEAEVEARACGSSPSIWRIWNMFNHGALGENLPEWAKQECAELVVPAVLLGGWSEHVEGDKDVIQLVTGKSFEEFRDLIRPFVSQNNPLLIKVGDAWVISAPATAFALVSIHITQGHLERLASIIKKVFEEIDPTIDMAPDERPYAGLKNVRLQHSTWLRDGLAGTLLRIAVIGQRVESVIPNNQTCQGYVDSIIRQLKGLREDWRLIASLDGQLPVLAEAAPIPFVEALESLLQGGPEKIRPIFTEGSGSSNIFGRAFHTNTLWALESLAWEPRYLGRVTLILAQLAGIDPGGNVSNRPINSLKEIFLAWNPGTSASLEQRLQALDVILEQYSEIGWDLLCALMPKHHDSSFPTHEPSWRDFGRSQKEPVTNAIVWNGYSGYIDRAISHAGMNPDRWKTLIDIYPDVSRDHQQIIEEKLIELSKSDFAAEQRNAVWETLRDFISKHSAYPDATWALKSDDLKRLESIQQLFDPADLLDKIAWLFNDQHPEIPFARSDDFDALEAEINRQRDRAVKEVWEQGGHDILRRFMNAVSYPGILGFHTFRLLSGDIDEVLDLVKETNQGTDNERFFARCLSGDAYQKFGDQWTVLLLSAAKESSWSTSDTVNAFLNFPDSKDIFDLVHSLGEAVERNYWERKSGWLHCKDEESIFYALQKFKENGRSADALIMSKTKWKNKDPQFILELLDQTLVELNSGKAPSASSNLGYYIEELFEWLRTEEGVDKAELARREYAYLPLLTRAVKKRELILHEVLATNPDFFIQVLCDLYKPASERSTKKPEDATVNKNAQVRAQFAWQMLYSWHRPPGVSREGQVDGKELNEWVKKARELAIEKDRGEIGDQEIGKVLYHFPSDPDDSIWPHVELRKLIENLKSEEIEHGIELEQFNSRGVVKKAVFEGGVQERELAQLWRSRAEGLGLRWPRTRAMLERIANSWESYAKNEDERAEQDRLSRQG